MFRGYTHSSSQGAKTVIAGDGLAHERLLCGRGGGVWFLLQDQQVGGDAWRGCTLSRRRG